MGQIYTERKESGNDKLPILTVSIHTGVSDGALDETELGKRVKRSEDKSTYKIARKNDLVFNMMRAWQGAIGTVRTTGMVSPAYIVAYPNDLVEPIFMDYLVKCKQMIDSIHRLSYGVTDFRLRLYWDSFVEIPINVPSLEEQNKIASFLTLLDKRIAKQRELVENLKSYKRGLVFSIFKLNNQYGISVKETPMRELLIEHKCRKTEGLRVCSVAVNKGVVDQIEHLGRSFAATNTSNYGRVRYGDVIYTKSPTGSFPFGIVKQSHFNEDVAVSPLYGVYEPQSYDIGFLLHIIFEQHENTNNYIKPLAQKGAKNTINITNDKFLDGKIILPNEQSDITKLSELFEKLQRKIAHEEQLLDSLLIQKNAILNFT